MSELAELSGCGPATVTKLEEAGILTLKNLAVTSPIEIATVSGVSEKTARKLIQQARESLNLGFQKASEYAHKRDNVKQISVGCEAFDTMLDGGFESGSITEVYGETASGKTQISHLMVVRALLENKENKAMFIDSENTFRASRIKDFCEGQGLDYDDAMERLYVTQSHNTDEQLLLVDEVEKILQTDNSYRILVIDSLTSHFRAEYSGRGELAPRQQKLNKHLHQLLKIASVYNLVVLVTNQVSANPAQMFGDPTKPIGGNIVSHSVTSIIYLRKGKAGAIHAQLVDSPHLPKNECDYFVKTEGFVDV